MNKLWMGIDGGGSTLRVVVIDEQLRLVGENILAKSVNPDTKGVGHDEAKARIKTTIDQLLQQAAIYPDQLGGAAIGIAGADAAHAEAWLRTVMADVLPGIPAVLSADYEIALFGARGQLKGVLVLAGTGSIAYGINDAGERYTTGGWGALLGDEGSGYWLGLAGMQAAARASDGRGPATSLLPRFVDELKLANPRAMIRWLHDFPNTTAAAATHAKVVMDCAENGDVVAQAICQKAVDELALMAEIILHKLSLDPSTVALTGGLLERPNLISLGLCQRLGLPALPVTRHTPAVGAALLAQMKIQGNK